MEELSGKVQKPSTHASGIGVDIAVVERDCATDDADATSILPNNERTSVKASTPSGQWGGHGGAFGGVLRNALEPLCSSRSGKTGRSRCHCL